MAAAVVQPLSALLDANAAAITTAAAKGISPSVGGTGMTAAASNPFSGFGGSSLFGKPAAAAPAPASAPGTAVSASQWLAHAHTDAASKALAHQHVKLHRFLQVAGYGAETKPYVRARISELARGHCLGEYKWDSGGTGWREKLPTDAEVFVHLFKVSRSPRPCTTHSHTRCTTKRAPSTPRSHPHSLFADVPRLRGGA